MEYRHSHCENLLLPAKDEEEEEEDLAAADTPAILGSNLEDAAATPGILGSSFEAEPSDRPRKTLRLSSSCSSLDIYR